MNRIANTLELRAALQRILDQASEQHPSRTKIASELMELAQAVGGIKRADDSVRVKVWAEDISGVEIAKAASAAMKDQGVRFGKSHLDLSVPGQKILQESIIPIQYAGYVVGTPGDTGYSRFGGVLSITPKVMTGSIAFDAFVTLDHKNLENL